MNQARGLGVPVVLLDGGDAFFLGATKKALEPAEEARDWSNAQKVLGAYNILGYQAVAVGPADLQLGVDRLKLLEKAARFPFLCANIVDKVTEKPLFRPYLVLDAAGVKLGIYAVIQDDLNETYVSRVLPQAKILPAEKVTRAVVEELSRQSDVIIALSQLNVEDNTRIIDAKLGIDVLLDPFSNSGTKTLWIEEGQYATTRGSSVLLRADGQGAHVGVFEMYFEAGKKKMAGFRGYDVPLEPHILRHPEMTRFVEDFGTARSKPVPIADPSKPRLVEDFFGDQGCGACHEEQLSFWKGTRHATAFATLQKSGDQNRPECFICHSYGYGVTFADPSAVSKFKDVQCESCHGLNARHAETPKSARLGAVADEKCWGCHNEFFTKVRFNPTQVWSKVACPKIKR